MSLIGGIVIDLIGLLQDFSRDRSLIPGGGILTKVWLFGCLCVVQRAINKEPEDGNDDIRDQLGVSLCMGIHVAVAQVFLFNALLAWNEPTYPLRQRIIEPIL